MASGTDRGNRTYLSVLIPSAAAGGTVFFLGAVLLFKVLFRFGPRASEIKIHDVILVFLIGAVLFLALLWRIRFASDHVVLYSCTFLFPRRIDFGDVVGMTFLPRESKRPGSPVSAVFILSSGKPVYWSLGMFSIRTAERIREELESRIEIPGSKCRPPDFRACADRILKPGRWDRIVFIIIAALPFFAGVSCVWKNLAWDHRVRTWDKVEGIVLKNGLRQVKNGRNVRQVADVEFEYARGGRRYVGTRIVYDSDVFPPLKVGTRRQVIVNPADPKDAAIMFWYRGYLGLLFRWSGCAVCFFLAGIMLLIGKFVCRSREITVPDKFEAYLAAVPPRDFYAALAMERLFLRSGLPPPCPKMKKAPEHQGERYAVIRDRGFALPLLTVFDFEERKICLCHRVPPETPGAWIIDAAEIHHIRCFFSPFSRAVHVYAVRHDGTPFPLCEVGFKNLDLLFALLPDVAEKLGRLPIVYC